MRNVCVDEWVDSRYLATDALKKKFSTAKPFPYLKLKNFFVQDKAVGLLQALMEEQYYEKESDLFSFMQTNELKHSANGTIKAFRNFLMSDEFISYMGSVTGCSLQRARVDLHSTLYQNTDHLLCHDDELDSRKIAFLLYLSNMGKKDGGSLDLYSSKRGVPDRVVASVVPRFNTFAFFEVSKRSFHSVSEVLVDKQRIALGGWFHAD